MSRSISWYLLGGKIALCKFLSFIFPSTFTPHPVIIYNADWVVYFLMTRLKWRIMTSRGWWEEITQGVSVWDAEHQRAETQPNLRPRLAFLVFLLHARVCYCVSECPHSYRIMKGFPSKWRFSFSEMSLRFYRLMPTFKIIKQMS